jgi:hypothetical protein
MKPVIFETQNAHFIASENVRERLHSKAATTNLHFDEQHYKQHSRLKTPGFSAHVQALHAVEMRSMCSHQYSSFGHVHHCGDSNNNPGHFTS